MCTPPLGPVGASPDDSQAARQARPPRAEPCGYPCAGVWSPGDPRAGAVRPAARGRGCGRACRRRGRRRGQRAARTTASAYAVLINVPGAQSSGTLTSPAGSYQYRDLVAIHSYTAGSALSGERAYGHSDLSGVTPAGRCRDRRRDRLAHLRRRAQGAGHRLVRRRRHRPRRRRSGGLGAAGRPVRRSRASAGARSNERRVVRSDGAYRGSEVALHIHLTSDWHNLPAGTEILLGYSDAAAAATPGADTAAAKAAASPATAGAGARGGGVRRPIPDCSARRSCPVPASDGTPTDSGDGVTPTGIEAPPPGGFTLTPPIIAGRLPAADRARLRLPGGRRRALRPRLRQLPRRHGLPRGQRPVRARGDAARRGAVRRAAQRRLEPPRRLAAVGRGHSRQLVLLRAPLGLFADREGRRPRQRRRRHRLRRQHGRRPGRADAPALRDPPGRPVGRAAVRLPAGLAGPPQPVRGDPRGAAAAARRRRGARLHRHLRRLGPRHRGGAGRGERRAASTPAWWRSACPAPTAAELLAAAPSP